MAEETPGWFARSFGREKATALTGGPTVASPSVRDAAVARIAMHDVSLDWNAGDVILDLYEVRPIRAGADKHYAEGGMGRVYRMHHKAWNIDLAAKVPLAASFQTQAQKDNFIRECETWVDLGLHPHIVSCHYVRDLGGAPVVFAEFVESGNLKDWIETRRLYQGGPRAALDRILDIAIQFAWGLDYAHGKGLVHQDVKPANVMIMPDGTAKITDFGLARARAAAGVLLAPDASRTRLVSVGGMTPAYGSPEQANNKPLSRKTDMWSWAVSVLEMFVGEVCWQSGVAAPHLLQDVHAVQVRGVGIPELPPAFMKLLEQCLAAEPSARPESFSVIADSLKSMYGTHTGEEYARPFPESAELKAGTLNNHAISMLDLGRLADAESLFSQALASDPTHAEANFNSQLLLWRSGRITDASAIDSLTNLLQTHSDADLENPV